MTFQPHIKGIYGDGWIDMLDGNDECRDIFDRHYSRYVYADGRKPKLFVGPGEKMVLLDANGPGLFVWRKFKSKDGQEGINCAIFRNETRERSSDMIRTAMKRAFERWPAQRLFTYVDPREVTPTLIRNHPTWGFCFVKAGWRFCGWTKARKLMIFEWLPEWENSTAAAA